MATIDQLIQKIQQLEDQLAQQTEKVDALMDEAHEAVDYAKHAYRVDHYGYIWVWDTDTEDYKKTKMRIVTPVIADQALQSRHIADGAVLSRHIADNQILSRHIAPGEVRSRNIGDNQILSRHIPDLQILSQHIGLGQIEARNIAPGAVDISKIKDGTLDGKAIALNSNLIALTTEENGDILVWYGSSYGAKVVMEENGDIFLVSDSESGDVPYPDPSVPGRDSVGSEQIIDGSIEMKDLSDELKEEISKTAEVKAGDSIDGHEYPDIILTI